MQSTLGNTALVTSWHARDSINDIIWIGNYVVDARDRVAFDAGWHAINPLSGQLYGQGASRRVGR